MPVRLLLLGATLLLCQSTLPAAVPPELEGCKVFRVWDFATDDGGWKPDHNVGPFKIADGILSFENVGTDPWIVNRSVSFAASDYKFVGIKMRTSVLGWTQVFFGTDELGGPAAGMSTQSARTWGPGFRFYEYDMSGAPLWDGKISLLRIDAVNGGGEIGAKVDIDWIAVYQPVGPTLRVGRPYAGRDAAGVFVSVPVSNVRGPKSEKPVTVSCWEVSEQIECPGERETTSVVLRVRQPWRQASVRVVFDERTIWQGMVAAPFQRTAKSGPALDGKRAVELGKSLGMSEARLLWPDGETAGLLRPLGALAYKDKSGGIHYVEPCPSFVKTIGDDTVVLQASERVEGGSASFRWTVTLPRGSNEASVACELSSTVPIKVMRFEGPRLLAGEATFGTEKTHGLFPGLEYLDKNEPTGAARHVGPKFASRSVPDPYDVTVPLMAVETERGVVGLSWDPLQEWAAGERLPCAEFESPNMSEGAANHLMTLFSPSIPEYVEANGGYAYEPYLLEPGSSLRIAQRFFARLGRKVIDLIPDYYRFHGIPKPPPIANGLDGTIDVCLRAYTESLYFPDQNGWKDHFGLHQTPSFHAAFAATVLAESIRRGDPELTHKIGIEPGAQLSAYTGVTTDWFSEAEIKRVDSLVALLRPDGSYPYQAPQNVIERVAEMALISGSDQKALGDEGETNSGLTLRVLNPILEAAARTGNKRAIEAGLRGLGHVNSCTVPRGSQTWEVHAHAPDVLASALAVQANLLGYEIMGESKYLDYARFWAYTGLPFVYGWMPPIDPIPVAVQHFDEGGEGKVLTWGKPADFYTDPRRQINPGSSIAVFGTTYYVSAWFGRPVQWCGIAWAVPVRSYLKHRPDPILEALADAVFASSTQQLFDKGWAVGTYPDAWGLRENTVSAAFINPYRILDYAYDLKGEKRPSVVSSRGFDMDVGRCVLSTFAIIESCEASGRRLGATLKYYPDQDLHVAICPTARPASVEADGILLADTADLKAVGAGYHYDDANRALHIKCKPTSRIVSLGVTW